DQKGRPGEGHRRPQQGQDRRRATRARRRPARGRVGRERHQAPPKPEPQPGPPRVRWHHRGRGPDPRVERGRARSQDRQADQGRLQVPRRWSEGALRARFRRNNRPLGERAMPARLQEHYTKTVREALTKEFSYKNAFEVPKLDKIVINMGVGEAVNDRKAVDGAAAELAAIPGQKPVITKSRKSIATFKLREGMAIGAKVTLRRDRMYEFI